APRHTPPPESGKQVAAAPSVHPSTHPASAHPASVHPASAHPASAHPSAIAPGMGPRAPGPPQQQAGDAQAFAAAAPPVAQASGTRLSPDDTKPELGV